MDHVAANNEIIRMRATVRKARVGVVWKITKEVRLLKNRKHGDEKALQKCKKKSERLIKEIKALKKLKDDDITKFAILNARSLQDVLTDPKADRKTSVMTKVAYHKVLKPAIDKFKLKFPDYKLGKRQLAHNNKLTAPLGMKAPPRKVEPKSPGEGEGSESDEEDDDPSEDDNSTDVEEPEEKISSVSNDSPKHSDTESKLGIERKEKIPRLRKNKDGPSKPTEQSTSKDPSTNTAPEPEKSPQKLRKIKAVSKLASVKRLKIGESLEETDAVAEHRDSSSESQKIELETAEDSFFVSPSQGGVYRSIITPRPDPKILGPDDSENRFEETTLGTQTRNFKSSNRSQEKSGPKKPHKVRRNDRSENEFPGRGVSLDDRRGPVSRSDRKIDNRTDKHTINKKDCGDNLHPSWLVKKKQQEIMKQGFQGKKIVFGDD